MKMQRKPVEMQKQMESFRKNNLLKVEKRLMEQNLKWVNQASL